jgi:hypothetical protein
LAAEDAKSDESYHQRSPADTEDDDNDEKKGDDEDVILLSSCGAPDVGLHVSDDGDDHRDVNTKRHQQDQQTKDRVDKRVNSVQRIHLYKVDKTPRLGIIVKT